MAKLLKRVVAAADSPPPERAYDNAVRKADGTDWAFTLYVVDSLQDAKLKDKTPASSPTAPSPTRTPCSGRTR